MERKSVNRRVALHALHCIQDYWSERNAWFVQFWKAIELRGSIIRCEPKSSDHSAFRSFGVSTSCPPTFSFMTST
ncbi:hypothetical protein M513_12431 [Trichuris suis]|uniref:Uncharacterized protein n=1 Tax=Trichuris suis TaxID=68888 RepID=A0A085LP25_9BILA|nr:hypothetical protein M513_12431 [Trichuris suis]